MAYFVIIRGPAASGKTTIAKMLAKTLNAMHISIDEVLRKHKLDVIEGKCIGEKNFIKANDIAIPKAIGRLSKGKIVIFDGNFYHKSQINDLIKRINYPHVVFTLKASKDECVKRDKKRKGIGKKNVEAVYNLSKTFKYGKIIDAERPKNEVIKDVLNYLAHLKNEGKMCI
jgi:tRNA uridine 5-carbamoylmethylation protein Kti12